MVKIGLEIITIQEEVIVKALLNNGTIGLIISLEFARKQEFKLKEIKRPIYMRNMNGTVNKEEPIEYRVLSQVCYGLLTITLKSTER